MVVIVFDISDDKNRRKVVSFLKDAGGQHIQRSLFHFSKGLDKIKDFHQRIEKNIDKESDSFRVYYVCKSCEPKMESIGKPGTMDSNILTKDKII